MPFLEIQLPTGHKNKIEVNNNSSLISVLNEICMKRHLNIDFCYLVHNKVKQDLSVKFGMSKLINYSKLELLISPVSLIENVKLDVTLQLPTGIRLTNTFTPNDNLWDMLKHFSQLDEGHSSIIFPNEINLTHVVFHMHDQIKGEYCLKNTSLALLGFRSGRVLLRFELKDIGNDEIEQCNETLSKIIQQNIEAEKNYKAEESSSLDKVVEPIEIPSNIDNGQFSRIESHFPAGNEPSVSLNDFSPFSMFPTNKSMFDKPAKQNNVTQERSKTLGELIGRSLERTDYEWPNETSEQTFMNFKFPESTAGKNIMQVEEKPNTTVIISHEDRPSLFYYRKPMKTPVPEDDVPDSFFEVTEADLRQMIESYRKYSALDSPLITLNKKEEMREAQFSKYKRCIIQFHFKDAYILQSVFNPKETVGTLYEYVKFYLQNFHQNFTLYTVPSKHILKNMEMTLLKSDLLPMARVYVSEKAKDLCTTNFETLISDNDEGKARELISKWMEVEQSNYTCSGESQLEARASGSSSHTTKRVVDSKTSTVPKWFKK